jgi:hypothetical protein
MDERSPIRGRDANALGRGCLFALIGGALLLGAATGCLCSAVRWWGAERTEGTIVALEVQSDDDGVAYYPVVEYKVGAQRFRCKGSFGFRDEMGVRGYALGSLGCLGAFLAGFVAVAGLLPVTLGFAQWWAWFVAGFCGLALVGFAATHIPLLVRGGTYRVVVHDGWLRVDSPHRSLGPSFDVPLPSVQRLVICNVSEGMDRYEIHTCAGEVYELKSPFAKRVFEVIQGLHPGVAVESRNV